MKIYKVAIVENDEDERLFMAAAFNAFGGFELVGEFENGDHLLEWLQGEPELLPELIVSDLNMPGKNGYDILSEAKAGFPDIPVIITSTSSVTSIREKCLGLGALAFLIKPDVFIAYGPYVESLHRLISREEQGEKL